MLTLICFLMYSALLMRLLIWRETLNYNKCNYNSTQVFAACIGKVCSRVSYDWALGMAMLIRPPFWSRQKYCISTITFRWTVITLCTDILGSQRMNRTNFGDPLTFLFLQCHQQLNIFRYLVWFLVRGLYWMDCNKIW